MTALSPRGLLVLLILLVISTWLWLVLRPAAIDDLVDDTSLLQNNFFLESFSVQSYDADGHLVAQTDGKQFIQSDVDSEGVLFEPTFTFFQQAQPNWTVTAQRAYVQADFSQASLRDDVLLRQVGEGTTSLFTSVLDIDLIDEIVDTTEAVRIEFDTNQMTSNGMTANLKSSQIDLLSNVRSTYVLP